MKIGWIRTSLIGLGPFVGVNRDTLDGKGKLTISGRSSLNGSVSAGVETDQYHVDPDCTGTCTVSGGGITIDGFFVIDQGSNEISIDTSREITGQKAEPCDRGCE